MAIDMTQDVPLVRKAYANAVVVQFIRVTRW